MFKCSLLTTTAFVLAGSLALMASQSWANTLSATAGPGRDRNEVFLRTYGAGKLLISQSSTQTSRSGCIRTTRHWQHIAVPIAGKGRTVSSIIVKEATAKPSGAEFSAGIYSNGPSGLPSGLIAGGTAVARKKHPELIVIPIKPTMLQSNTTYWVAEQLPYCLHCLNKDYWKVNKRSKQLAYVQDWRYSAVSSSGGYNHSFSSSDSWTALSAGPFVKVK